MAKAFLQDYLKRIPENEKLKKITESVINKLNTKTIQELRQKYIEIAKKKQKRLVKLKLSSKNQSQNEGSKSVEPTASRLSTEEVSNFLKKLKLEKKQREKRQKDRENQIELQKIHHDLLLSQQTRQNTLLADQQKQQKLLQQKEISSQRKKAIQDLIQLGNSQYQQVLSSKPLFAKIEENYLNHVKLPELHRHKQELAKKRELFQPINRSSILQHARKHDLLINEHSLQKLNTPHDHSYDPTRFRTNFTTAYIQTSKKHKFEREQQFLAKKNLMDKKKHYANLVLQMFPPTVDPSKQLELRLMKERLEENGLGKRRTAQSLSPKDVNAGNVKKRKWKINSMIPQMSEKKEVVVVDWLALRRGRKEKRKECEWDRSSSHDFIRRKVEDLENEVRRKEMRMEVVKQVGLKGIMEADRIGELLIDSIRAKMALLEKE